MTRPGNDDGAIKTLGIGSRGLYHARTRQEPRHATRPASRSRDSTPWRQRQWDSRREAPGSSESRAYRHVILDPL